MKSKTWRTLLAGSCLMLAFTASLATLSACGGSKAEKASLKLSAGGGGTLKKTEYSVKVGTDLADYLEDITPSVNVDGLTFAGWYNGDAPIAEDATMPKEGLTLTAKYNTGYTVNVYTRNAQGDYGAAQTTTGTALWHTPLDIFDVYTMPEGYVLDSLKKNVTSTQSLEANFAFELYEQLGNVLVTFDPNAPDGVDIGGTVPSVTIDYGKTVTVPASNYTAPTTYRMLGWATEADGGIVYHAGDTFEVTKDITLYAVWAEGKTDIFGGDDIIFLTDRAGEVYLHRAGLDEKEGSYDGATEIFTFTDGGKEVLEGKIVGDSYYYFRDLRDKTFRYDGETNETLVFGEKDTVVYTVTPAEGEPAVTKGTYTADPVTGDYLFESEGATFYFTLAIDRTSETVSYLFVRSEEGVGEERGFYALYIDDETYDATQAIQLDGMYDGRGFASAGLYTLIGGKYVRQITTYYGREEDVVADEDTEAVAAAEGPVNYALLQSNDTYALFRLEKKQFTENGRTFDGIFRIEDGYRGEYATEKEVMEEKTSLSFDGFGGAVYQNAPATYTVGSIDFHGLHFEHLVLETAAGKTLYIQFYSMQGQPYYEASETQPKVVEVANSLYIPFGYFASGEGGITLYDTGFFYFYDDTHVAIYTYFTDTFDGVAQYSRGVDYGILTAKDGEDGVYGYESWLLAAELLEEGETLFDIRYTEDGEIEVSFLPMLMQEVEAGTGDKKLVVDKWGTLTYGGESYAYGEYEINDIYDYDYTDENGYGYMLREYNFGDTTIVLRASIDVEGIMGSFDTVVPEGELLELAMKRYPGQTRNFDRIYFIEGLPTNEEDVRRAGIVLLVSDDGDDFYEQVLLYGDLVYSPDEDFYSLTLDYPDDETLEEFYYAYGGEWGMFFFAIDTFEGRVAAVYLNTDQPDDATSEDGSTLVFDYRGTATYTPADGEPFTGTSDLLAAYGDIVDSADESYTFVTTSLYSVTSEAGKTMIFLVSQEEVYDDYSSEYPSSITVSFELVTAPEAGLYAYSSGSGIYFDTYLVFFGAGQNGEGIYYEDYISTSNEHVQRYGTYRATDLTVDIDGTDFTEYALTYTDDTESAHISYVAVAKVGYTTESESESGEALVFVERAMPMGTYAVREGGVVYGNGYAVSEYTDAEGNIWYGEFGRENLIDTSPKGSEYVVEEGDHSKDGKQLFFYAYFVMIGSDMYELPEARHFLFDVIEEEDGASLSLRATLTGTFAFFEKGVINETALVYFDGHGNGNVKRGGEPVPGTYTYDEEENVGVFTPATGKPFNFAVFTLRENGETWNLISDTDEEHLYLNNDWSVLSLYALGHFDVEEGIFSGVYTDRYGASHYGVYEYYTDTLVAFTASTGESYYFKVNDATHTFTLNEEEFVIEEGVLYAYQGPTYRTNGLVIPEGVKVISNDVFSYMYIMNSLNLNQVEKIGARAFYQTYVGAHELNSEFVTEIGDEAFFTDGTYDYAEYMTAFNFITDINMPKLQTIGVRAFYYANQMGVQGGTITLRDIKSIGEQAFMHNVNPSSGTMKLDLTQVPDLSKVTIADTAFDDTLVGAMNPDGLPPVFILINFTQLSQTANWPEKFKDWFTYADLKSDPALAGQGFLSAAGNAYYEFIEASEEIGAPSVTLYTSDGYSGWTEQADAFLWSVEGSGDEKNVCLYTQQSGVWVKSVISFALSATTVKIDGATCYRTEIEHTLTVKEGEDETEVIFTFSFEVEKGVDFFDSSTTINPNVLSATYDGKKADYPTWSGDNIGFNYVDGNDTYQVTVNVAELTSALSLSERVVEDAQNGYRATFGGFTESGTPSYLNKLEKKNGEGYDIIISDKKYGEKGTFKDTKTAKAEGVVTTTVYTVTYTGGFDAPAFTVTAEESKKYEVTVQATEENKFRATFLADTQEPETVNELTKFEVWNSYGYFEETYGEWTFGATVEKGTESNTFTVTVSNSLGTTVYTVKYVAKVGDTEAHIEVTVSTLKTVTIQSTHADHDDYYEIKVLVDETGKVLKLTSFGSCSWDSYFGSYGDPFDIMLPDSITRSESGKTVTFDFTTLGGDHYTVVIDTTNAASDTYTATVTKA